MQACPGHALLQVQNNHSNAVAAQDVKAPEYVRRPQGLGLGAQPAKSPSQESKKRRRPGEAAGPKPDLVYIDPATGLQKNVAPAGAVLTERVRLGVHQGKRMRVSGGRHQGLLCDVLAVDQQVRLLPSSALGFFLSSSCVVEQDKAPRSSHSDWQLLSPGCCP